MKLHTGTIWNPVNKWYFSNVYYGTTKHATKVLGFMIVGLSGNFKHLIAYVLQDECTASLQSQMIKDCIYLLHGV